MNMKRYLILFVIVVTGYLLQSSVFAFLPLGSVTPDLLVSIVVSFALLGGSKEGLWLGFFCGLILDVFYGPHIGFYALIYMYIGFLNGLFRHFGYAEDDIKFPIFMVACSEFIINVCVWFFLFFLRGRSDFFYYLKTIILPKTVYTTTIAVFTSYLFLRIHQMFERTLERGDRELDL